MTYQTITTEQEENMRKTKISQLENEHAQLMLEKVVLSQDLDTEERRERFANLLARIDALESSLSILVNR